MLKIDIVWISVLPVILLLTAACSNLSSAQTVSVWITTDNQKTKLKQQSSISFSSGSSSRPTVFVDETQAYQSIGFWCFFHRLGGLFVE